MKELLLSKQGILVTMTAGLALFGLVIWLSFGQTRQPQVKPVVLLPKDLPVLDIQRAVSGQVTFQDVQLKNQMPDTPPEMLVYIRSAMTVSEQKLSDIGEVFGFTTPLEYLDQAKLYIWQNDSSSLTLNINNLNLIYRRSTAPIEDFQNENQDQLKAGALDFLKNHQIAPDQFAVIGIDYLKLGGGEAQTVTDYKAANLAVVNLVSKLSGYSVYGQNGLLSSSNIWVGSDNQVYKASIALNNFVSSQKTLPIAGISHIIPRLVNGEGKVVSINNKSYDPTDTISFTRLEIESLEIGYFADIQSTIVQPIYVIKGKGFLGNDKAGSDLVIYIEARNE